MSNRHQRTLKKLFQHPIPMNVKWKDIVSMFEALGSELEVVQGGRQKVILNGEERTFHIPHSRTLDSRDEIVEMRHFLERAGFTPDG